MAEQRRNVRRRIRIKKRTVVDSAARNAAVLTDGCNPEFVVGADFDGIFEIPIIKKPRKYLIPKNLVPFSKMHKRLILNHLRYVNMKTTESLKIFCHTLMTT